MQGDDFAYDRLGDVDMREVVGRNAPATFDDIEHSRRKIARRRFVINLPIDASDVRGALQSPGQEYQKAVVKGAMRQMDRIIAGAAFSDVATGRNFENTVTFANDGGLTVDATAGLTYEKLLEIQENFIDTNVDGELFLTLTGKENTSLMKEEELTSGDYVRERSVDKGRMVMAAGLDLIHFAANETIPILDVTGGVRSCFAATKDAICVGMSKEANVTITPRYDLIETTQVQIIMEMGAVRTEGGRIQKVTTTA